jgi:tetratricopeptide (TPR) repeat protein
LERVTTDNLEALRKFSQGIRLSQSLGPNDRSRAFFEEAVSIDTAFASAWRALGVDLRNTGQERARMVDALSLAVAHEDRLTETERHRARGIYFSTVTGEPEKAVREYESLLELEPDHRSALIGAGVAYGELRDFERAAEYYQRARDAHPGTWLSHYNLVELLSDLGRFEEAEAALDSARVLFGESDALRWTVGQLAATRQDYREAVALQTALWEELQSSLVFRALLASDLASLVAVQGRLAEADAFITDGMDANESRGVSGEVIEDAIQGGWIDVAVRRDPLSALQRVEAALELHALEDMDALDRPYLELAELFAAAGQPGRARILLDQFDAEVPVELRGGIESDLDRAAAEVALAEGDHAGAVELFRRSDKGYCILCPLPGLARAYEASAQPDSAIVSLEKYVNSTWFYRFFGEDYGLGALLGPSLERLAQLYDEAGDPESAAPYYARFVELWEDADAPLQPRVQAAQRRLEQIIDARG